MNEWNRAWWDERVPIHVARDFYDVKAGRDPLGPFAPEELGAVEGRTMAHLQCHFGLDSIGWARRGARVTGLDFSQPAVDAASELARELGLGAEFVCADVHDAAEALEGRHFEIVYTGGGDVLAARCEGLLGLGALSPWTAQKSAKPPLVITSWRCP